MDLEMFSSLKNTGNKAQLFCFPYLGGHANVFFEFAKTIQFDGEIWSASLPGHGNLGKTLLQDIRDVVDLYANQLYKLIKNPYFFLGYSMGGIIAYFLAQHICSSEIYSIKPSALILSACGAPNNFCEKNYSSYSDKDLLQYLLSYNGIPNEIINEKTFLEYLMPIFRADFKILESASTFETSPLNIPTYFLWGEHDPIIKINSVTAWLNYFSNSINLIPIANGSHMFIHEQLEIFSVKISEILNEMLNKKIEIL